MPPTGIRKRLVQLWRNDIWEGSAIPDRSPRGWFFSLLGIVSISLSTFSETKTGSRAADLSFSSLLGLGPLIAIGMLVASTVLGQRDPNLSVDALNHLISFVAPQLDQYASLDEGSAVTVNPQLVEL